MMQDNSAGKMERAWTVWFALVWGGVPAIWLAHFLISL